MINLKDMFENIISADAYQRVDDTHPLDLYVGKDRVYNWTLLLVCNEKPKQFSGSRMIEAKIGKRKDDRWTVSLSLVDSDFQDIFVLMCNDIIESSRLIKNTAKGAKFVINRYLEWKEMFANKSNGLLTDDKVKGLLGEMYFLDSELMDQYECDKAALSWTGPKALHQDFIVDDTWYEIKTVSSGKAEVQISSVEQLDCASAGTLVVIFADKTSSTNENAVTLNMLYSKILDKIEDDNIKTEFSNMLLKYGYYPRPEYDNESFTYEIKDVWHYKVDKEFPCLRRSEIPSEVTKATYFLSLPSIAGFREDN